MQAPESPRRVEPEEAGSEEFSDLDRRVFLAVAPSDKFAFDINDFSDIPKKIYKFGVHAALFVSLGGKFSSAAHLAGTFWSLSCYAAMPYYFLQNIETRSSVIKNNPALFELSQRIGSRTAGHMILSTAYRRKEMKKDLHSFYQIGDSLMMESGKIENQGRLLKSLIEKNYIDPSCVEHLLDETRYAALLEDGDSDMLKASKIAYARWLEYMSSPLYEVFSTVGKLVLDDDENAKNEKDARPEIAPVTSFDQLQTRLQEEALSNPRTVASTLFFRMHSFESPDWRSRHLQPMGSKFNMKAYEPGEPYLHNLFACPEAFSKTFDLCWRFTHPSDDGAAQLPESVKAEFNVAESILATRYESDAKFLEANCMFYDPAALGERAKRVPAQAPQARRAPRPPAVIAPVPILAPAPRVAQIENPDAVELDGVDIDENATIDQQFFQLVSFMNEAALAGIKIPQVVIDSAWQRIKNRAAPVPVYQPPPARVYENAPLSPLDNMPLNHTVEFDNEIDVPDVGAPQDDEPSVQIPKKRSRDSDESRHDDGNDDDDADPIEFDNDNRNANRRRKLRKLGELENPVIAHVAHRYRARLVLEDDDGDNMMVDERPRKFVRRVEAPKQSEKEDKSESESESESDDASQSSNSHRRGRVLITWKCEFTDAELRDMPDEAVCLFNLDVPEEDIARSAKRLVRATGRSARKPFGVKKTGHKMHTYFKLAEHFAGRFCVMVTSGNSVVSWYLLNHIFSAWCAQSAAARRIIDESGEHIDTKCQELSRGLVHFLTRRLGRGLLSGNGGQANIAGMHISNSCYEKYVYGRIKVPTKKSLKWPWAGCFYAAIGALDLEAIDHTFYLPKVQQQD